MTRRYFVADLPATGGDVELSVEESQHAVRVMRVQVGESITLFDGLGHEAEAEIVELGRNRCRLSAAESRLVDRETPCGLELAIALPKPDRARELIERLTELGVRSVTPLMAARTQRPPSPSLLDKLRRAVVEACKQCGRNHLLTLRDPVRATDFFQQDGASGTRWIAHPGGTTLADAAAVADAHVTAAIGPEGGWSTEECNEATEQGFQTVGLGERIYRIETAATVIAAVVASKPS